jgi:DNA-binding transcriptional ArsR family regulator
VGELAQLCGYTSANVSRHLALLMAQGLVARESRGTSTYYRIADESIYALCDFVCDKIASLLEEKASERQLFLPAPAGVPAPAPARPRHRKAAG